VEKTHQFAENLKDLIPTFSYIYEEKINQMIKGAQAESATIPSVINSPAMNSDDMIPTSPDTMVTPPPPSPVQVIAPNTTTTTTSAPPTKTDLVLRRFSGPCSLRLRNDIKEFLLKPISNIRMYWTTGGGSLTVSVKNPGDNVWGDGWYYFRLLFGVDFPMESPVVNFISKIFHPNVYSDGTALIELLQKDCWSAITSVSMIAAAVRESIFVNRPRQEYVANHYAWYLYTNDLHHYHQMVQLFNTRFGSSNKRYQDAQSAPDFSKKQKTLDEEIDTEELYVSDQTFWMWGSDKEEDNTVSVDEADTVSNSSNFSVSDNDSMIISVDFNDMLMDDHENEAEALAGDFYL